MASYTPPSISLLSKNPVKPVASLQEINSANAQLAEIEKVNAQPGVQQAAGMPSPAATSGSVSANQLATPAVVAPVTPPVEAPPVDRGVIDSAVTGTQEFITAQSAEAERLNQLRTEYGALAGEGSLSDVFSSEQNRLGVPDTLKELTDIRLQLADRGTQSALRGVEIESGGQGAMQGARSLNQEAREQAVRDAGLAARAQVLQGNIETASTLVNQAVQLAYQDRTLRNTNMINQINDLRGVVDDQTQQLLDKEQRAYEADQLQITQATDAVQSAIVSGFASQQDVETMTALSGNPKKQKEYADKIVAKASRTRYLDALAATRAAANAARNAAATTEQGEAAAQVVSSETALGVIDEIMKNPLGIQALTGSTRLGRTSLSAGFDKFKQGFVGGSLAGGLAGSVLPGAGTVVGGAVGGVLGGIGGAVGGTFAASQQRADVSAGLGYLVNSGTFNEMRRLKAQGVTFGSLTEAERIAIGKSADALFSALEVDPSGAVTGVLTSEDEFERLLTNFQAKQLQYNTEAKRIASGLSQEDADFINSLEN